MRIEITLELTGNSFHSITGCQTSTLCLIKRVHNRFRLPRQAHFGALYILINSNRVFCMPIFTFQKDLTSTEMFYTPKCRYFLERKRPFNLKPACSPISYKVSCYSEWVQRCGCDGLAGRNAFIVASHAMFECLLWLVSSMWILYDELGEENAAFIAA